VLVTKDKDLVHMVQQNQRHPVHDPLTGHLPWSGYDEIGGR
jgi:hypothetical protein